MATLSFACHPGPLRSWASGRSFGAERCAKTAQLESCSPNSTVRLLLLLLLLLLLRNAPQGGVHWPFWGVNFRAQNSVKPRGFELTDVHVLPQACRMVPWSSRQVPIYRCRMHSGPGRPPRGGGVAATRDCPPGGGPFGGRCANSPVPRGRPKIRFQPGSEVTK